MQAQPHMTSDDNLQATKRQFIRWRATHLAGTHIPDPLWDAAAELANVHGLSRTARALGLDYSSLKRRTECAPFPCTNATTDQDPIHVEQLASTDGASAPPEFVEFSLGSLASTQTCVVEIDSGSDLKLRLDLKGYPPSELDIILRMAWETARCSS